MLQFFVVHAGGSQELLELTDLPTLEPPTVRITEYDRVGFVLRSTAEVHPWLYIQDLEMETPSRYQTKDCLEYRWEQSAWFLNHFGYSNLTLDIFTEQSASAQYASVEVFATKFNEERAEQILSYLESKLEDVTRTCFNATHKRADSAEDGDVSISVLLQIIEEHLDVTATLLPYFRDRKRKRVIPVPTQVKATSETYLTEHSVTWVMSHLDTLLPTVHTSPSSIAIGGRFYELDQVETNVLVEETNVYENQVICEYLRNVAVRLFAVEAFYSKQLELVESEGFVAEIPMGFSSISEIKRKFGRKHYGSLRGRCRKLQSVCSDQIAFLQKHIPVSVTVKGMPKLTSGFLAAPHYYQCFQQIVKWYRIGRLNFSGERYLYGLRTVDKLYEFFCLFRLLEAIKHCGWQTVSQEAGPQPMRRQASPEWSANPDSVYILQNTDGNQLTLYYEPVIKRSIDSRTDLVRTSPGGDYSPDFLIEVQYAGGMPPTYIVLDAKYVKPNSALYIGRDNRHEDYLTKITMKYLHGMGSRRGGASPVKAVFVLHPANFDNAFDTSLFRPYHTQAHHLFSLRPVVPVLGAIEVSPEASDDAIALEKLASVLKRSIEVLHLPITSP